MRRKASGSLVGAALLAVGLVLGAGLVFVSLSLSGGLPGKTVTYVSTSTVSATLTQTAYSTLFKTVTSNQTSGISGGGNSNLVTLSGSIAVPAGAGAGILVLIVRNTANSPITGLSVLAITPGESGMTAVTGQQGIAVSYEGAAVSGSNQVPVGSTASGAFDFNSGGTAGTGYDLTVNVRFANGSSQVQNLDITAQI